MDGIPRTLTGQVPRTMTYLDFVRTFLKSSNAPLTALEKHRLIARLLEVNVVSVFDYCSGDPYTPVHVIAFCGVECLFQQTYHASCLCNELLKETT